MWRDRVWWALEMMGVAIILLHSTSSLHLTSIHQKRDPAPLLKLISESVLAIFPRGDFPTNQFPTFTNIPNSSQRGGERTFSKGDYEGAMLGRRLAKSQDDKIYIFLPFGSNGTGKLYNSYVVLVQTVFQVDLYTGHLANVRNSFWGKGVVEWDYLMTRSKPVQEDLYLTFVPSLYSNDLLLYPKRGGFPLPSPPDIDLRIGSLEALVNDWAINKYKEEVIRGHNFVRTLPKSRIEDGALPFTGTNTCPYRPFLLRYLRRYAPITVHRVLQYLLLTLRAQCHPSVRTSSYRLFTDNLLSLPSHKHPTINLNLHHSLFSKPLLTFRERSQLLSAILLATYSQVFDERYKLVHGGKGSSHLREYSDLSNSALTLGSLVENVVEIQLRVPTHALKIQNALLLILSEWLREVKAELEEPGRQQISNERDYVIGLIHFVDNSIYRIFKI